jgi:DNA-directed RNA polymerase I subunit RPA2
VIDLDEEERKGGNKATGRPAYSFGNVKKPPMPSKPKDRRRSSIGGDDDDALGEEEEGNDDVGMAGEKYVEELDIDGLPLEGETIFHGKPLVCFIDQISGEHKIVKHKETEMAYVQTVRVLGNMAGSGAGGIRKVSITLRFPRQPIIGDKFSSRHGQKGTLGVLWPQESMPFTESGMSPDILINPHAFPSRMTIGMLIESMAGKAGAMHGMFQDGSPFQFHEQNKAVDYIGHQLVKSGYNYYGSEPLYSGQSGQLMHCNIFIGVVYYQRLRHMVSDKSQVRSTGPVTQLTRQPVKGRKKHGGIRLGEMERDALLSHGVAFCLHDRLMACSDSHIAHVCSSCGELVGVHHAGPNALMAMRSRERAAAAGGVGAAAGDGSPNKQQQAGVPGLLHTSYGSRSALTCSACQSTNTCQPVFLPYVYRYLANELAGMGVKLSLKLG